MDDYTPAQRRAATMAGFLLFFLSGVTLAFVIAGFYIDHRLKPLHLTAVEKALYTCPPESTCFASMGAPVEAEYVLNASYVILNWVPADQMVNVLEPVVRWQVSFEDNTSACLITASPPESTIDDPRLYALGDGLMHCLTGNFHR